MYRNTIGAFNAKVMSDVFSLSIIQSSIENVIIRYFNICILKGNIKFDIKLLKLIISLFIFHLYWWYTNE